MEALLTTSRALVGLAARSLSDLDADVTLPQFRTLVVLAARGPQRAIDLAGELGVRPSTATRMCDRLVRKKLVRRARPASNRREVRLTLTAAGRELVGTVIERRRAELDRIVAALPDQPTADAVRLLRAVSEAAGELPEQEWWLGWHENGDAPPAS
ncbi:MAG: MarR family winged helix-turn-helix transcriptional regulator [Mycobacteriales bacterium]